MFKRIMIILSVLCILLFSSTTVLAFCGNGILEAGESCDDVNNIDGDGCSANCIKEDICVPIQAGIQGWYAEYFNYNETFAAPIQCEFGRDPINDVDWFSIPPIQEIIEVTLQAPHDTFGTDSFFRINPTNGTNASDPNIPDPHYFGAHYVCQFNATTDGVYNYTLQSDDDTWLYLNSVQLEDLGGVHTADMCGSPASGAVNISEGTHLVEVYYADRRIHQAFLQYTHDFNGVPVECYAFAEKCSCGDTDEDGDGVFDLCDICPDSKENETVDANGCDPFQFCEPLLCGDLCESADFLGNEPDEEFPVDCTTVIVEREGLPEPRCVPLYCTD